MKATAAIPVISFQRRWQWLLTAETAIVALGVGAGFWLASGNILYGLLAGLLVGGLLLLIRRPWHVSAAKAVACIDASYPKAGFSSGLLLQSEGELPGLARLQRNRIAGVLEEELRGKLPPNQLGLALLVAIFLVLAGWGISYLGGLGLANQPNANPASETIVFQPVDSTSGEVPMPVLSRQEIVLDYPSYTRKGNQRLDNPNIKALQGSRITWKLFFEGSVDQVIFEWGDQEIPLQEVAGSYLLERVVQNSGFYSFRFTDSLGRSQVSDLYAFEALEDQVPEIEVSGIDQYTYFEPGQKGSIQFSTRITDDWGLGATYIIATVSKGSGESVKFREERLEFSKPVRAGVQEANLNRELDLQELGMAMGDELYFYVVAEDLKSPQPNVGRSPTYFAVLKDSVRDVFGVEAGLGVDLMPDYFRSQRQLIIDTEKLIASKPKLSEYDFKFRSNELGFDQKSLRIRYGQFMGEETEEGMVVEGPASGAEGEAGTGEDHDHEGHDHEGHDHGEESDPLAPFTHDHDGDNEHNLVATPQQKKDDNPIKEFVHDHSDPEEATFFEESLRAKLRRALDIMWDAELQLRLYKPEASLPYQYQALELLQEIKNSARIYVHRIGYDPAPIKEDKRLTGDLKGIGNASSNETNPYESSYPSIRAAIGRLNSLISAQEPPRIEDRELFARAGQELAQLAIDNPGSYLQTLRKLKTLETGADNTQEGLRAVRRELLQILPKAADIPEGNPQFRDTLNVLFLNQLQINE
ncbi:hypothetical protein SAMN04490243_2829 [Robiginitalea myxolifaciens]|uniref:Tryptophan-rich sensory protein n=1 Tax=Robiginitalea myxolifaciens TaxID=400055 RepID=A0A1I6HJT7_9FLAO|nr:hypothetical protein [Robiginitalea myxolifaciens]SFR54725.1 hypothetical protein SAMN04490243_2829 [Robiginitalea myxolifaciens]